jgi:hypothetical protein
MYPVLLYSMLRVVNAQLVKPSANKVLPAFAQCLQSFSNLHTLQIDDVYGPLATAIKTAFKGHRFLQIHTVIIPTLAHHILSSCPQVRDVTCTGFPANYFINTISKRCKKVEALDITVYSNYAMDRECFTLT